MKVDIWMDLTCPFCYMGTKKFMAALQQFPDKENVMVHFRSFELDPTAAKNYPGTLYDWLSNRYGKSREEILDMNKPVIQQAESIGLRLNLDQVKPTNSFDAHRLLHLAATEKKEVLLSDELFKAHFTDGKNISDFDILTEAGLTCDIAESEIKAVLFSDKFADRVREDEALAQQLSVRGVPFFLFNGTQYVSGSQSQYVFLNALEQLSKSDS
jgi:predicted DsbA family dithiol-disulfide isomerase